MHVAQAERFREVVLPHLGDALSLARWLTGSGHDAEDVVQEACVRAFAALRAYEGRSDRAWLLSIVRNTAFTWLAKNRPKSLVFAGDAADLETYHRPGSDDAGSPEAALIRSADEAAIQAAIEAMPVAFREIVVLRDVNGLSYKEIASMMKVPIGTVMSRLARARGMLATTVRKVGR